MNTSRDVFLTIGKGTYTIYTPLSDEEIDRVKALIDDACGEIVKGAKQEDMLMLTCLRLAYSLSYRSDSRTLKDEEVESIHMKVRENLKSKGYVIR